MRWLVVVLGLLAACKSRSDPPKSKPAPVAAPTDAASGAHATLEGEITAIRDKYKLPAIAAAAWRDGKLVEQAAVGSRKAGDATKVTLEDKWHLASNTKAMTATLIAMYLDRGTLRLTDTIGQIFTKAKIDPGYKDVTLDQLLRHEGGAPAEPPDDLWKQLWADGEAADARIKHVKGLLARPPAQKPGAFVYSNSGYIIAGAMLEQKTGKRWQDLMRDELFAKLDMKSCGFGPPGVKDVVDRKPQLAGARSTPEGSAEVDQPRGHDASDTPIEPGAAADNPPGFGPAGTVHCSLPDYGKFLNMIATGTPALVTPETMQHLTISRAAGKMGYAGGWMVVTSPKGSMLLHSGSNSMWYAIAVVIPNKQLALVIATNKGDAQIETSLESLVARFMK